jgi:hypothetical protein
MEGKSEQSIELLLLTSWSLVLFIFWVVPEGLTARQKFLSSMPFVLGMTGFSWSKPLMHLSRQTCTDLGWFNQATGESFLSGLQDKYFWSACIEWRMWVCLLIAKPVAISHLGIHYGCCWHLCWPVVGSSHWRPRSLLLFVTRRTVLEICEIWGTRWS